MSDNNSRKLLPDKILFSLLIILFYLIARNIPLCGVDTQAYKNMLPDAEDFIMQAIGGDTYQYSIVALGLTPFIFSGIIIQFYTAFKKSVQKVRVSSKKMNRLTLILTMIMAVFQAVPLIQGLKMKQSVYPLWVLQTIAGVQVIAGVSLIIWWIGRNKKYGIGGQTVIIVINIVDRIRGTFFNHAGEKLLIPCIVSFAVIIIMLIMENAEMRIPLQRVSIHNIYSDKNYLAIKLNPVGVMPVMFASAFYIIPQMLVKGVLFLFPDSVTVLWWVDRMTLSSPVGIIVYLLNLAVLTVVFALIVIGPGEMAEQFLQSGDSIVNLHAGKDTKRYLRRTIINLCLLSSVVMGVCIGVPLFLQIEGRISNELVMLPTSVMMLTGLWANLFREIKAIKCYDAYDTFL